MMGLEPGPPDSQPKSVTALPHGLRVIHTLHIAMLFMYSALRCTFHRPVHPKISSDFAISMLGIHFYDSF